MEENYNNDFYIIIEIKNKQYQIKKNNEIKIDFINIKNNNFIKINKILFFKKDNFIKVGTPYIKNINILAKIYDYKKIIKKKIIKIKRRKHFKKSFNYKKKYKILKIISINY